MWKVALLLLLQAGTLQREIVGPYTSREDQGQTTKVVLKNGLTVIVREEYAIPLVSVTAHIKTGQLDETDDVAGISKVIERTLLSEMARESDGVAKGFADDDRTVYSLVVPATDVLTALEAQAKAIWQPSFDSDQLKNAVETVLQESNSQLDDPGALASAKLHETAFLTHRAKRWPFGTPETLRAFKAEDIEAYYRKSYRPSNMILTVVGAADREMVMDSIVKLFGAAEDAKVDPNPSPAEPAQDGLRYAWRRGPVEQTHIALGFHVPGIKSEDSKALEVLSAILGSGRASRIGEIVSGEKSLLTSGMVSVRAFPDQGFFEVGLETSSPIEAATASLVEIESIKRFGVTGEAVGRAKLALAESYLGRMETVEGVGEDLAKSEAHGDWKLSARYLTDLQQVTPQRVAEVARKYLTLENLSVFEYLPESVERYWSANEYRAAVLDKVAAAVTRREEQDLPVTGQVPQRTNVLVSDSVAAVRRQAILRGPDVYILEDHRLPLVSFGIFFPGGRLLETNENAGITELMLRAALRGTRKYDSSQLVRRLENAGVRISVVNEPDFFGYMVDGLGARMSEALEILIDILQDPLFEEPQVVAERTSQVARIRNQREDNIAFPANLFMKSLFGDVPYGRAAVGTEEGIGKLTGTQLRDWFVKNERKVLPTIVIVGDTRGTALVAPIADALTNEDLEPRDLLSLPRVQPSSTSSQATETINRQQSALAYGFLGATRSLGDRYALDVVATLLSESAVQDPGIIAFPLRTTNVANVRGGALFTYAAFSPGKEAEVRSALDSLVAGLRKDGGTKDSVQRARERTAAVHSQSLQTRASRVLEYARAVYSGAGAPSVAQYDSQVLGITAEGLKSVMDRYLDPSALKTGLVQKDQ